MHRTLVHGAIAARLRVLSPCAISVWPCSAVRQRVGRWRAVLAFPPPTYWARRLGVARRLEDRVGLEEARR